MTAYRLGAVAVTRAKFPDAAHVLHGFRFQLLQSVGAWLALRPDEELLLEVSEDYSVLSRGAREDVQLKASRAAGGPTGYSLNSKDVKDALDRYWRRREDGASRECRLTFIAQGGAVTERDRNFPDDAPGLKYWRQAALGADAEPLREALKHTMAGTSLGEWLLSGPSDEAFRAQVLKPVQWALDAAPIETLQKELRDQTQTLALSKGLAAIAGADLWRILLDIVFETASHAEPALRRLTSAAFHVEAEKLVQANLVSRAIAMQMALAPPESTLIAPLEDGDWSGSPRTETLTAIRATIADQPVAWIHGAHGVGKSTLSRLLAAAYGGYWLAIDLKPLAGKADGLLSVWRSLHQIILMRGLPDGIVIDDFDTDAVLALWPQLKALARVLFDRGGRLILNSHPAPSPARVAELGIGADIIVPAPYFTQTEVADLLVHAPAPDEDEREAWAFFIRGSTGGGHPVLVAAKVASLRSRAWPKEALLEDVGPQSTDAVRASRQEARQVLLKEIALLGEGRSLDVARMLRRVASVVDRVDEGLILRLAELDPNIEASTDLLALLRGSWLELMPGGDLRVSPLLGDIDDDVSEDDKKLWRCTAAIHWMAGLVLNERTIPLIFWNAFLGRQEWVLGKFCQVLFTQARQGLSGAAALLSPIMVFAIDKPIYVGHALINANLRMLQFEVAEALENGAKSALIAKQLIDDIEAIEIAEIRPMMTSVASSKVLMAAHADLTPSEVVRFALLLRGALRQLEGSDHEDLLQNSNALVAEFYAGLDQASLLFAHSIGKIKNSSDFLALIQALDPIAPEDRNSFLDASSVAFDGLSVLVNSGWSRDQLEDRDMQAALEAYQQAAELAAGWGRSDIMIQLAAAISVLFDEGLRNEGAALAAVDEAVAKFGPDQGLIRQKAKVLGHYNRDHEAADLILSVEDMVGGDSLFDRALALRDGASSAARAGKYADAARLFGKAATAIEEESGARPALLAGLKIDCAMATWDAGDRACALTMIAEVFDLISSFDAQSSRQAERAHQFARGVGGLFAFDVGVIPSPERPNIAYGGASALSTDDEPRLEVELKPLPDNWRILALAERASELDVGIGPRSLAAQTGPGIASFEFLFFLDDYARALRRGDLDEIIASGAAAVSTLRIAMNAPVGADGMARVNPTSLAAIPLDALLEHPESKEALYRIPADVLIYARLRGRWSPEIVDKVHEACGRAFGVDDPWLAPFFEVASSQRAVTAKSPMPVWSVAAAAMNEETLLDDPEARFKRDLLLVLHAGASAARKVLEPIIVEAMHDGWGFVLERQRFRLTAPATHAQVIEAVRESLKSQGLRGAAMLLLEADGAVRYGLTENLTDSLRKIARLTPY